LEKLRSAVVDFDVEATVNLTKQALEKNIDPPSIVDSLTAGLREVGDRFEKGTYFLPMMMTAARAVQEAMEILTKATAGKEIRRKSVGKFLLGTVKGDLHDIGKNLVRAMLEGAGFEVYDLGIDVPPEKFVEKAKGLQPDIVGMSALVSVTIPFMETTIKALKKAGITAKTMVGGAPVTADFAKRIGADAYGEDAFEAVKIAKKLITKKG